MSSSNLVGQILEERYRVDRFIGTGGMSVVYRVWDLKRQVPLAMKVLRSEIADDPSVFKRFIREANALKKLSHPNIVPFYDLFNWQESAVLIEHYVDGTSLKAILKQHRVLSTGEALVYLKAISAALGFAHAHGVIHCDVKPDNILIDQGGDIYLTDFGIARHADSTTTTVGLAGTSAYMAPEQIRIEPVTAQTDVYSLGVMVYEMLAGQRPFLGTEEELESSGTTASERMRNAHLHLIPPDPREVNPAISLALSEAILKSLSKEPAERFQSTTQFLKAIAEAANIAPEKIPDRAPIQRSYLTPPLSKEVSTSTPHWRANTTAAPRHFRFERRQIFLAIAALILVGVAGVAAIQISLLSNPNSVEPVALESAHSTSEPVISTNEVAATTEPASVQVGGQAGMRNADWAPKIESIDDILMAFVPVGCFTMGSEDGGGNEAPMHRQCFDQPFWIDVSEVTNQAYGSAGTVSGNSFPRDSVSWFQAEAYCQARGGRLPTEAEWEYAARGPDGLLFPWGDAFVGERLNHCDVNCNNPRADRTSNDRYATSAPVMSYPDGVSWVGAHDMSGNLWEWVLNAYISYPLDLDDLLIVDADSLAVVRGGSWESYDFYLRATTRFRHYPRHSSGVVGFRCVLEEPD